MKLLVLHRAAARGARGGAARKTVVADWVRVGRNASCEIHLPDPRVALEQGMIVQRDGLVYIEGETGNQNITRKSVRSVRFKRGEPVTVGPYVLELQDAPEGYDGAISVELVRPLELEQGARPARTTLASLGISKRWTAWTALVILLVAGLALPLARVLELPWKHVAEASGLGDRIWNPGPLTLAHQPIEIRCGACHTMAFRHVRDGACLECHRDIGQHVAPELQPAALFAGERCATCHREHKGVKTTHRDDDSFCIDCHRDLQSRSARADPDTAHVTDFAQGHPAFRVSIPAGEGIRRVRQGEGELRDPTTLKFPHAKHLDAKGVRSPERGRVKLDCGDCHVPDASRRGFEPVSMAKQCQGCHRLEFEPAVTAREVPHGKSADVAATVEEFYANLALKGTPDSFQKAFGVPGEGLLRRVGDPGTQQRENALRMASRKAHQVTREIFEVRLCKACHEVGADWSIAPVRGITTWMPHARFDHKAHAATKCTQCHAVKDSKTSADVALPQIAQCRECHGGSRPVEGRITSNCLLCHGFHDAAHPWDPAHPRAPSRVVLGEAGAR